MNGKRERSDISPSVASYRRIRLGVCPIVCCGGSGLLEVCVSVIYASGFFFLVVQMRREVSLLFFRKRKNNLLTCVFIYFQLFFAPDLPQHQTCKQTLKTSREANFSFPRANSLRMGSTKRQTFFWYVQCCYNKCDFSSYQLVLEDIISFRSLFFFSVLI